MMAGERSFVDVGRTAQLRSASARHHITLRHRTVSNRYHSLLLFSFPNHHTAVDGYGSVEEKETDDRPNATHFYCMEAVCPHLGAPLENASIYDVEVEEDIEDAVIVCPWHEYDFSLRTGESSTGLKACVFAVEERDGHIWVQCPSLDEEEHGQDAGWDVIEVRPVSEAATNGRQAAAQQLQRAMTQVTLADETVPSLEDADADTIPALDPEPQTLVEWAVVVLNTPEPRAKVEYTRRAAHAFRSGHCRTIGGGRWRTDGDDGREERIWLTKESETPPAVPPRLSSAKIVQPGREAKRGKGGSERSRIAMLHSLANIEQWAIDLTWDIIARASHLFARCMPHRTAKLPVQFFSDFVKVAEDEAKHFTLLQHRLEQMGARFGDLPVHHGLWDSAVETMNSLSARLCIIHLVHEARGLDANPLTIKKFDNAGDKDSVEVRVTWAVKPTYKMSI